jgi:hypothetical protein
MGGWLLRKGDEVTIALRVQPRASRDEFAGLHGDRLRVRITAPPVDGAANEHLRRFLAGAFDVPASRVRLLKGTSGRDKLVSVSGVGKLPEELERLAPPAPSAGGRR